jgi:lipoprotein-anchoring transpeptidase ErfK/SrfK
VAEPGALAGPQETLAWQIALEREGFSPGILDGKAGRKTTLATEAFQLYSGLAVSGRLDEATAAALRPPAQPVGPCPITAEDARRVTGIPGNWIERSELAYAGYDSLADLAAEKGHCTQGLLAALNPGLSLGRLKIGDTLQAPQPETAVVRRAETLDIDLGNKILHALDGQGRVVGLWHCSVAADVAKRPSGTTAVTVVAANPEYLFDPQHWPEVHGIDRRLTIHPGPRNPVGLCWIGLALDGYGIHGSPHPEQIGKTGSHGCFRLTNWDALHLAEVIGVGAPVHFTAAGN